MSENAFLKFIIFMLLVIVSLTVLDFVLSHNYRLVAFYREQQKTFKVNKDKIDQPTNEWFTYNNERYGYKIKHPADLKAQTQSVNPVAEAQSVFFSPDLFIEFLSNEEYLTVKEYGDRKIQSLLLADLYNSNRRTIVTKREEKIINNLLSYIVEYEVKSLNTAYSKNFFDVYIGRNLEPDIIRISWNDSLDSEIVMLMLQTFQFNQKSAPDQLPAPEEASLNTSNTSENIFVPQPY